jgi:transcriptional regulator with AAA-type ATPase domain
LSISCGVYFNLEHVQEVEFNNDASHSLLIPEAQKQMVLSLATVHKNEGADFDDVIKGKGVGMVFLLHGEPGTGKTLTAGKLHLLSAHIARRLLINYPSLESVAEFSEHPLCTVTAG